MSERLEAVQRLLQEREAHTVHKPLNIRVESYEPEVVIATDVDERLYQPGGVVHGGVYVLLAESAASVAACLEVDLDKEIVLGLEINANHLRPTTSGVLRAIPRLEHKGRTTMVFAIDVYNDDKRVCISRCTVARRPKPQS